MAKKPATASEKRYMSAVQDLGCAVCGAQAELHHPRMGQGASQRSPHFLVIPLCPRCHRTGGHGVAIHAGQSTFEQNHGTESVLLAKTIERMFIRNEKMKIQCNVACYEH